ncbi:MAG: T9SS type A sorting domain-containing protein [Candidatus Marinimicrobia bacterium]|nr:T9SS type A sorting domain-containing protein [Candidatus Neomarinimicrobiota bacterium]
MKSVRKYSLITLIVSLLTIPLIAQTDVILDIGEVNYPAYADSLLVPVTLTSLSEAVAGIQFDLVANPALTELLDVFPGADVADFSADFSSLTGDTNRVILFNAGAVEALPAAGDTVLWLLYDGTGIASAVIGLEMFSPIVSDTVGGILTVNAIDGSISIGSVVSLSMNEGDGDINEMVTLAIDLENPDVVGGVQFDLLDLPDYVSVDSVWTTVRTDGFTVSTSPVGTGERVILFSGDNQSIAAGTGSILNVRFLINPTAYAFDVVIDMVDAAITDDLGGLYWIAGITPGIIAVYPGYLEPPTNLVATSGLDGHVPLAWAPPVWDIPGDTLGEGFEGAEFPPEDWTQIQTCTDASGPTAGFWSQTDGTAGSPPIGVHSGAYNAGLWWSYDHQDEWLITPEIALGGNMELTFWSYGYEGSTYSDHYYVKITTDGGTNWDELLDLSTLTLNDMNMWSYPYVIDLSDYSGQNVQIAWQAIDGDGGGLWYIWFIDDILITNSAGRIYSYETGAREMVFDDICKKDEAGLAIPNSESESNTQIVIRNSSRTTRDLTGYNMYRSLTSPVEVIPGNLIATVPYTLLTYDDNDVTNGLTYFYVVTGDYGAMGESGPSNEDLGVPVEWVELEISGGLALTGQTDTLDIFLNNESDVSFFFLEIADIPDYLIAVDVLPTPRTNGFTLDAVELPDGKTSITGLSFSNTIAPGSDPICRLVVLAAAPEPAVVDLNIVTATIWDVMNNVMPWTQTGATFEVTVETQTVIVSGAVGIGTATVSFMLHNTQNIHAFQFTLVDAPNLLVGMTITATGEVDLSNWTIGGNDSGGAFTVVGYDGTLNSPIEPGMHHIADITFAVSADPLDWGTVVDITAIDLVLADFNGIQLYTETHTNAVSVGYPDAIYSVENLVHVANDLTGSFDIFIQNQVAVYALELDIIDLPDYLTVTDISTIPGGPFSSGIIDGSSGEVGDGTVHISAFELSTGIAPTMAGILRVNFEVNPNYPANEPLMVMITETLAADQNFQALNSMSSGYLMFSPVVAIDEQPVVPEKFALHANYPNPFNPVTRIRYDLSEVSQVKLTIYDMLGREVRTLVNGVQQPGQMEITWDGTDQFGRMVGAGVYLYRIQANKNIATRKMILLK